MKVQLRQETIQAQLESAALTLTVIVINIVVTEDNVRLDRFCDLSGSFFIS